MTSQPDILIRLEHLRKEFNGLVAVEGLDLEVAEGEFLCFLGPSGCGKTTTLRMIAGLETPTAGEIYLRGQRITDAPPQHRNVGFVFQNYALFWHMSVYDNLAFGLRVRGTPPAEVDRRVRQIASSLELTPVLGERTRRLDLSAMQRVAMGRTLVTDPHVLLLDEPLNNFRPGLREIMRGELKRWQMQLGRTMIYVTHDQEEAMTLGDRILVMNAGRCEQLDTPRQVYQHPANLFVASFIGRPPMNLLQVVYRVEGDQAVLAQDDLRINVTPLRAKIEPALDADRRVILGVRPEHIRIASPADSDTDTTSSASTQVDLVQPLGRKKIVDLKVGMSMLKMVVPGTCNLCKGDCLAITFDLHLIHLFHPETERAIL